MRVEFPYHWAFIDDIEPSIETVHRYVYVPSHKIGPLYIHGVPIGLVLFTYTSCSLHWSFAHDHRIGPLYTFYPHWVGHCTCIVFPQVGPLNIRHHVPVELVRAFRLHLPNTLDTPGKEYHYNMCKALHTCIILLWLVEMRLIKLSNLA